MNQHKSRTRPALRAGAALLRLMLLAPVAALGLMLAMLSLAALRQGCRGGRVS
jgi:hypothetical protein